MARSAAWPRASNRFWATDKTPGPQKAQKAQMMNFAEYVLLTVVRNTELRDSMIGDLREEAARYAGRFGASRASRWHLRQSLSIAVRYGFTRLLRRKPPVRWISIASMEPEGPWWTGLTRDVLYARRAIVQRPLLSFTVAV